VKKAEEQLNLEYVGAQVHLNQAQQKEAAARWGTKERDEARAEAIRAADDMAKAADQIAHPERYEEKVILLSPNERANLTDSNGVRFEDGKALLPRSVAERYVDTLDGYEIQEKQEDQA
jgi:hypothetical protein